MDLSKQSEKLETLKKQKLLFHTLEITETLKSKIGRILKKGFLPSRCKTKKPERKAILALVDGTIFQGEGFGAIKKTSGEVVFNTGMVGYPESITDPSYNGQILTQTYPLIGNYGVCTSHLESDSPKIEGYIVRELCKEPSHWASEISLDDWLYESGIPGIEHVDTRMLTKKLRVHGVMLGILWVYKNKEKPSLDELKKEIKRIPDPNKTDLVAEVATKKIIKHYVNGKYNVVLIDCGVKRSIIKSLTQIGINVIQVPPNTSTDKILKEKPDGIVISNGPGDPKMVPYLIKTVRELIETKIPMMGICLGNQILALSLGGDTFKLKFGHRGQNHPVIDLSTGGCYITSQNHGFAVDANSLASTGLEVTHINANDKTVEGLRHTKLPVFAVQFHPEAAPGPEDSRFLFDRFLKKMKEHW
jgi:carbamoyl-phosphate synthase small subunit